MTPPGGCSWIRSRGYERDFDRVVRRLRDGLGLARRRHAAVRRGRHRRGGRPEGVQSSRVRAGARTRSDVAAGLVLLPLADIAAANVQGVLDDVEGLGVPARSTGSVRRARSVLRELAGVHPPAPRARLRTELKWVQAVTGPLRDRRAAARVGRGAGERAGELAPLRALLEQRRAASWQGAVLRSRRFAAAIEAWRALAEASPYEEPRGAPDRCRRGRPVRRGVPADGARREPDRRREPGRGPARARKRGKELRYLLDLSARCSPATWSSRSSRAQGPPGRARGGSGPQRQTKMLRANADDLAALSGGPGFVLAAGLVISAWRPTSATRGRTSPSGSRPSRRASSASSCGHLPEEVEAPEHHRHLLDQGGIGKTSAAVNLAALAAQEGRRTSSGTSTRRAPPRSCSASGPR